LVGDGENASMATWPTIAEAVQHLRIGKSTLYQMVRDGKVLAHRLGRVWPFDVYESD